MGETTGRGEDPVVLRPSLAQRICPLIWLPFGVAHLLTATPGELLWVLNAVLVAVVLLTCLALQARRDVMTRDALIQRRLLRTTTYPLRELTLHEHRKHIKVRHSGGRLLLHLPRGEARLSWRYEPSLPWPTALRSMQSLLGGAERSNKA